MEKWIWQHADWPHFTWQEAVITPLLLKARHEQGVLLGKASHMGDALNAQSALDAVLDNILSSSAIEGEAISAASLRSSLAKRLPLNEDAATQKTSARTEGLATMMLDALQNHGQDLSLERLFDWHHCLFPDDVPRLVNLHIGQLRGDAPMQVVSGRIDAPTVHFEAPPRDVLDAELQQFLAWFNRRHTENQIDGLLRAGIAHLWLITLHPFDDGNGRLTRAVTDLALAQDEQQTIRLYAMSSAILKHRAQYYAILEQTQKAGLDITPWLEWFLQMLLAALAQAQQKVEQVCAKWRFWQQFYQAGLLPEQIKVLNRLLDGGSQGFEDGISAAQYKKVTKVSKATATRHLADLLSIGCIERCPGGGRSTRYRVKHR